MARITLNIADELLPERDDSRWRDVHGIRFSRQDDGSYDLWAVRLTDPVSMPESRSQIAGLRDPKNDEAPT